MFLCVGDRLSREQIDGPALTMLINIGFLKTVITRAEREGLILKEVDLDGLIPLQALI